MMENELKPCPFCGHDPKLMTDNYEDKHVYWPQCLDPDCIMSESASTWPTKAAAIAAWNARAAPEGEGVAPKYCLNCQERFCEVCDGEGDLPDAAHAWDCGENPPECHACNGTGIAPSAAVDAEPVGSSAVDALNEIRSRLALEIGDTDPNGEPEDWKEHHPLDWAVWRASRVTSHPSPSAPVGEPDTGKPVPDAEPVGYANLYTAPGAATGYIYTTPDAARKYDKPCYGDEIAVPLYRHPPKDLRPAAAVDAEPVGYGLIRAAWDFVKHCPQCDGEGETPNSTGIEPTSDCRLCTPLVRELNRHPAPASAIDAGKVERLVDRLKTEVDILSDPLFNTPAEMAQAQRMRDIHSGFAALLAYINRNKE